jgi:hypothetical protein
MAIVRYLGKEKGLDLKSSDLRRGRQFASDGSNFDYDQDEDLTNRPGVKRYLSAGNPSYFLSMFNGIDESQQQTTHMIFGVGTSLRRIFIETIRIQSFVNNSDYKYEMYYDETQGEYYAQVLDGGTALWSMVLDNSETILDMITDFNTTLAGIASMTASAATNLRANDTDAISIRFGREGTTQRDAYVRYYTNDTLRQFSNTIPTFSNKGSTALLGDVLYIAPGRSGLHKYDGQAYYKAGMPKPDELTYSLDEGTGPDSEVDPGTYYYKIQYEFTDNPGNIVTGPISEIRRLTVGLGAGDDGKFDFTSTGLGGRKLGQALATNLVDITYEAGDNIVVQISNDNGLIAAGDRVYWRSYTSGEDGLRVINNSSENLQTLQTGRVTNLTGSTISITTDYAGRFRGAYWPDISTISVLIWRTLEGFGGYSNPYYLAGQIPFTTWGSVYESTLDSNLVSKAIYPDDPQDYGTQPPPGAYIAAYRNQLVITGINNEPDNVYFSEPGFYENFPIGSNVFKCTGGDVGDKVTGLGPSEDFLLVTKDRSIFRVTGDLGSSFAVDRIKVGIGCVSHYSIQEISQGRMAFLSHKGPWQVFRGQEVTPLGPASAEPDETRIASFFLEANNFNASGNGLPFSFKFEEAHGHSIPGQNKYYLNIPVKRQGLDESSSVMFVYDFHHDTWSRYDDLGCVGDLASFDTPNFDADRNNVLGGEDITDLLWFFRYGGVLMRMYRGDYYWQHNDQGDPILMSYATHWEGSDSPSQLKKFLRPYVLSVGGDEFDLTITQQLNWDRARDASVLSLVFTGSETNLKGKFREQRARSQRLVFSSSTINQKVKISGYELEVETPYAGKMKE